MYGNTLEVATRQFLILDRLYLSLAQRKVNPANMEWCGNVGIRDTQKLYYPSY